MNELTETDILFAGTEIELNGESVKINPYTWTQAVRAAKPFSVVVKALVVNLEGLNKLIENISEASIPGAVNAIAEFIGSIDNADEIIGALSELMVIGSGKSKGYIDSLKPDEAVKLGCAIYDVNKSFFTKCLASTKTLSKMPKSQK